MQDLDILKSFEMTLDKSLSFEDHLNGASMSPEKKDVLSKMNPLEKKVTMELAHAIQPKRKRRSSLFEKIVKLFTLPVGKHDLMKTPLKDISNEDLDIIHQKLLDRLDLNYEKMHQLPRNEKVEMIDTYRIQRKQLKKCKNTPILSDIITDRPKERKNMELNLQLCQLFDENKVPDRCREQFYQMDQESKQKFVNLYPKTRIVVENIKKRLVELDPKYDPDSIEIKPTPKTIPRKSSHCEVKFEDFQRMYQRYKIANTFPM
jgi:hypothetical protein